MANELQGGAGLAGCTTEHESVCAAKVNFCTRVEKEELRPLATAGLMNAAVKRKELV